MTSSTFFQQQLILSSQYSKKIIKLHIFLRAKVFNNILETDFCKYSSINFKDFSTITMKLWICQHCITIAYMIVRNIGKPLSFNKEIRILTEKIKKKTKISLHFVIGTMILYFAFLIFTSPITANKSDPVDCKCWGYWVAKGKDCPSTHYKQD